MTIHNTHDRRPAPYDVQWLPHIGNDKDAADALALAMYGASYVNAPATSNDPRYAAYIQAVQRGDAGQPNRNGDDFSRVNMREEGFYRRIMPDLNVPRSVYEGTTVNSGISGYDAALRAHQQRIGQFVTTAQQATTDAARRANERLARMERLAAEAGYRRPARSPGRSTEFGYAQDYPYPEGMGPDTGEETPMTTGQSFREMIVMLVEIWDHWPTVHDGLIASLMHDPAIRQYATASLAASTIRADLRGYVNRPAAHTYPFLHATTVFLNAWQLSWVGTNPPLPQPTTMPGPDTTVPVETVKSPPLHGRRKRTLRKIDPDD